jgi:hypothetical protein
MSEAISKTDALDSAIGETGGAALLCGIYGQKLFRITTWLLPENLHSDVELTWGIGARTLRNAAHDHDFLKEVVNAAD